MKKFFLDKWPLVIIVLSSLLIIWPLFLPGYFSHHDNLQVIRIFEMRKCFSDLQIPCRWVSDMGFGNGYPIFNFYGVLPYYFGAILSYVFGYIGAAKLLFLIPLVLGGVGMFLLSKEIFGKIPGFVSAILYLFAPYRALDAYVRGAIGESFALAIIPFVFYFILKLAKSKSKKYFVLATVTTFLFLISHNIMTLIFTPLIIAWILFCLFQEKWKGLKVVILSFVLSVGLASFFLLPAFFEKNLVQTDSLTRAELDFRAQFVKVSQLFIDRSWNYGGSQPKSINTISYQIGWPHWLLVILAAISIFISKKRKDVLLFIFFVGMFMFGVFMTHNTSAPIWEHIKILAFVQFPWRFLSFAIFSSSLIGGYFITMFDGKKAYLIAITFSLLAIILNWQYFKPEHFYYDLTDSSILTGQNFILQQSGALLDYLPKTALEPREPALNFPIVVSGNATVTNFIKNSNSWSFNASVTKEATVEVPVFYFPNWTVNYPHKIGTIGRIAIILPIGTEKVQGNFTNTPIRTFGNSLTLVSFVILLIYAKNRKLFI